ncbi:hypothetical protein [Streptomyces pacificus]|uniref:HTH merR-type domain-containing protein n=1 Tax=Streptomyces pacificus TaxID=2705029 RepID=A0A6A0B524_9ACTN|nr:hypothetical protein [Streptomyces pacificus]GFH38897.1 hypothetical protein SCWH03_51600 [Streptomyces pacificus]
MSRLVDTAAAALGTGVKPATMRKWLQRGKLTKHGHDYYGRAIVDLDEIRAIQRTKDAA